MDQVVLEAWTLNLIQSTSITEKTGTGMAVHENLVIGDKFYDIHWMQNQYTQPERFNQYSFKPKDAKFVLGIDCFTLSWPLEYHRGQTDEPRTVQTSLGCLRGDDEWPTTKKIVSKLTLSHSSMNYSADTGLNKQINSRRYIESYGTRVRVDGRSRADVTALQTLKRRTQCENGRCKLGLLWSSRWS